MGHQMVEASRVCLGRCTQGCDSGVGVQYFCRTMLLTPISCIARVVCRCFRLRKKAHPTLSRVLWIAVRQRRETTGDRIEREPHTSFITIASLEFVSNHLHFLFQGPRETHEQVEKTDDMCSSAGEPAILKGGKDGAGRNAMSLARSKLICTNKRSGAGGVTPVPVTTFPDSRLFMFLYGTSNVPLSAVKCAHFLRSI